MFILKIALVFIATFILDWLWAAYIINTSTKNILKSCIYSALILLTGAFITMSYVEDKRMLIPALVGGVLGTYFCVKYESKTNE